MAVRHCDLWLRPGRRVVLAGFVAGLLSGCSSEASRLSDPFSNPFQGSSRYQTDQQPTSTISRRSRSSGKIVAEPLPPLSSGQSSSQSSVQQRWMQGTQSRVPAAPTYGTQATSSPRISYSTAPAQHVDVTGTVNRVTDYGHWSGQGGTPIVVAQGETVDILARRYGMPADALLKVNGMSGPADVQPGVRMVVPVYNAVAAAPAKSSGVHFNPAALASAAKTPATQKPLQQAQLTESQPAQVPSSKRTHRLPPRARDEEANAETSSHVQDAPVRDNPKPLKTARLEDTKKTLRHPASSAKKSGSNVTNLAMANAKIKADKLKLASVKPDVGSETEQAPKNIPAEKKPVVPHGKVAGTDKSLRKGQLPASLAKTQVDESTPTASLTPAPKPAAPAVADAAEEANPEFRWPAHGRIIQGYKSGSNDGINIAVPEGTSVKAAEGGIVAYAGNELKGYGNLVLIRHPNGFVSAYANNGSLEVKRGDSVKRGQTIAQSGQSGNVTSPQVHFELRKGQQPVDPTKYLAGL